MKNRFSIILCALCPFLIQAQGILDGLRYSKDETFGSARYSAMSGAFTALGGDMSAVALNPASSAVFLQSMANVSLGLSKKSNQTDYFGNQHDVDFTDLEMHQAGGVFVFGNQNENSVWRRFSLAISYQNTNNFKDEFVFSGQSTMSIDQYFLHYAQGIALELLETLPGESISDLYAYLGSNYGFRHQQAFLGYQGYIIDPTNPNDPANSTYLSAIAPGVFNQYFAMASHGDNSKLTFNIGAQLTDRYFIGINLNAHSIDYRRSTFFSENNANAGSVVNRVYFDNELTVQGDGFSAQLGIIAKATEQLRLGLTFQTPEFFSIREETMQALETRRLVNDNNVNTLVRPNVVNVYEEYNYRTPGKITAGAAYVFGSSGLLSLDYSFRDFSSIKFSPSSGFKQLNDLISEQLTGVSTISVGGEYRYQLLSIRGGYKYESSPYKDKELMGDLNGFSFGLGVNFGSFKLDAAFARTQQERQEQLFQHSGFANTGSIDTTTDYYTLTATFDF